MKPTIIILFSFFLIKNSFAQTVATDPELDKFVGVWRWKNGTDTMEITLQKQVYFLQFTNTYSEILVGWHRYIKNGTLQQSSYQYLGRDVNLDFNDNSIDLKSTLGGMTYSSNNRQAYFYTFWDLALHKNFNLWLTLLPNSTTQATWELKQGRCGLYVGPPGLNGVYSMPKQIIITKL